VGKEIIKEQLAVEDRPFINSTLILLATTFIFLAMSLSDIDLYFICVS
jgi:hypothetical protein